MGRVVSIGAQGYEDIRSNNYFYVDKTGFIEEWWESGDKVTLITRPRRFGKTLNMSMLECFFSVRYAGRKDLFEGLNIWKNENYREMQGTWPVIFLSFANVKEETLDGAGKRIKAQIERAFKEKSFLLDSNILYKEEISYYKSITRNMSDDDAADAINNLCFYLNRYYGKKVIILLDEYDTPMQEAWLSGYWDEFTGFIRSLFNSTFKTNPYLERAVMTGITRVTKESIFSDLNNLKVITVSSDEYSDSFGFTEEEVFESLDMMGMPEEKNKVKSWYDGFTFGTHKDIYNPWSVTNFLDERKYKTYWADTSSNGLISSLLQKSGKDIKQDFESLMKGNIIEKNIDEQVVFNQLDNDENAIWSLMTAGGYLKVESVEYQEGEDDIEPPIYRLSITNREVKSMFGKMLKGWFGPARSEYNDFIKAMLKNDTEEMNIYMNDVALSTFSYFDTGKKASEKSEPERFFHGFVLGLLVELRGRYEVSSNRESGYGRYDVCLIPLKENDPGIVIEFKVFNPKKEKGLEDTVESALRQIEDRKYDTILMNRGVTEDRIRHYGFAFEGSTVLIGE